MEDYTSFEKKLADLQEDGEEESELSNVAVLRRDIQWDTLERARIISDVELRRIKSFDKKPSEDREALLADEGAEFAELFVNLVSNLTKVTDLQYVLAIVDELLEEESRVKLFTQLSKHDPALPFLPFIRLLARDGNDLFVKSRTSKIVATLLSAARDPPKNDVRHLSHWCAERLRPQGDPRDVQIALTALQRFLRKDEHREIFVVDDGLPLLSAVIRDTTAKRQLIYLALYSLWLVSYNPQIATKFSQVPDLVRNIVDIIRREEKEKIRRMGLAVLSNIMDKGDNNEKMIDAGMIKVLAYLNQKKWGDEDIEHDLEHLTESLERNVILLSSFEKYKEEVLSGELTWSPVHRSERFWRENVGRFDEDNFRVLEALLAYIREGENPKTMAIACYDIGEFVRFHPSGRRVLSKLGGKIQIMALMEHRDAEVQKEALLAVQKMMVHNWEYLARAEPSAKAAK
eukprot:TRINITY_DN1157_c0_g1_i1.p1 TRINITY_DN1157_c0_g1~~TRINITY_DN1157_c0_g1_i1.p1  ORF type:complete len:459 (-),score=88.11 TRINITY_DN1157_c0_g1_i1:73-1449(-)